MRLAGRIIDVATDLAAVVGGLFTGLMTLIVVYAVVARYIFNSPVGWSEEIAVYLMIWVVFLGAAYALKEDAHIGVDVLISRLSPAKKRAMLLMHCLVGITFMSILLVQGIDMVIFTIKMDSHSIAIGFPLVLAHLAVPVGSAILILQFINKLVALMHGVR
jgi:TRAP-type C4-dicarboxylate transport system permease small subunit